MRLGGLGAIGLVWMGLAAGCDGGSPALRVDGGGEDAALTDRGAPDGRVDQGLPTDAALDAVLDMQVGFDPFPVDAGPDDGLDARVEARDGDVFDALIPDGAFGDAEVDAEVDAEIDQGMIIALCPDGTPVRPEACNGLDDDCDGATDEGFGLAERCEGEGRCGVGFVECDPAGGTRCSTNAGGTTAQDRPEQCNARDDDCDGQIDEGEFGEVCYDGPPETIDVGACRAGRSRCVDGRLGACEGEVGPRAEQCDGIDEDCDGVTDEGYRVDAACGQGVCRETAVASACEGGVERVCAPGAPQGNDASCDGRDEDCDGSIDEGFLVQVACGQGRCAENAQPSACVAGVERACMPGVAEGDDVRCDGIDEDCDGQTDESVPAVGCGLGACRDAAVASGCDDGVARDCVPGAPTGDDATCDGLDEDCDGQTDESFEPERQCGVGVCATAPTPGQCVGGVATACIPSAPTGDDGDCNGLDDDCDGRVDEGYVVVEICGTGVCRDDALPSQCVNGVERGCLPGAPAALDDRCDGLDDDCNGEVDEDVPGLIGGERRLTQTQAGAIQPQIARGGDDALVIWTDNRDGGAEIYAQRLDADGASVGVAVRIAAIGGNKFRPSIAVDGTGGYGIAWHNTRTGRGQVRFAKVDAAGVVIRADVRIVNSNANAVGAQLAFDGNEFGLVWTDERAELAQVWFQRISAAGEPIGEQRAVAAGESPASVPAIAPVGVGEGWMVVYNRDRAADFDVFAQRLDAQGAPQGAERQISAGEGNANAPRITRHAAGFVTVWYDTRDANTEIYAARIGLNGARVGDEQRVTSDPRSSFLVEVTAAGAGLGVVWTDRRNANNEIWFRHLDADAAPFGPPMRVSVGNGNSFSAVIDWREGIFETAWYDARHGANEIYVARGPLGCASE
ncbi:MAG: hypothetical protein ACI9U2_003057 [Bradymonadia bacterium]|jgi:hypothetical protein